MTVPVPGPLTYSYDEDGVTTVFAYPVRFLEPQELMVIREVDGAPTVLAYNVDYTVSGAGMPNGGSITRTAVTNGGKIIITRRTAWKQIVDLEDKARNPAEAVELQMDRLTMAGQDNARRIEVVEGQAAAIDDAVRRSEDAAERSENAEGGSEAAQQAAEAAQEAAEQAAGSVLWPVSYGIEQTLLAAQRLQAQANIGPVKFDTVAGLLADTILDYSAASGRVAVATGKIVEAQGYRYEVAASGASDHHVETAGGVKLYVLPDQQGAYAAAAFGVSSAVPDNTAIYNRIIAALPANSKIVWPDKQTLLGHFLSQNKVFALDLNGSTLVNTMDNQSIVQMGHGPRTAYDVTEVVLPRGARSFTVVGAASLFASGHIGYLWDSAVRPGGTQGVNYEVIKIDRVEGDTVYLQWPLYSYKGAGALKFYYSPVQHKNASIRNGKVHPTNTHIGMGFSVWNCDGVDFDRHRSENTSGRAFDCRYSINFSSNDTFCDRPRSSGSGEGYGLALYAVTGVRVRKAHGYRCRHAYDQDSVYDFDVSDVYDPEDQSSCCALAHNGFASDGYLENVRSETSVTSGVYAVSLSAQGYGRGANEAKAENHCFYNVYIDGVQYDARLPLLATAARIGVYAQNSISGRIANVRLDHEDTTNPTSLNANGVRINGVPCGDLELSQIGGKRLGAPIFLEEVEFGPAGKYVARIRGITVDEACWVAIFSRGAWAWSVDGVNLNAVLGPGIIQSGTHFSHLPVRYDIGSSLSYSGADVPIISSSPGPARPAGSKALSSRSIPSAVAVVDGASISTAQLENRDMRLVLSSPSGAGSITLSATTALPQPAVNGAQAYVSVPAGLNDVVFPAGNNIHAEFTIAAGSAVRLVSYSNKWALA